MTRSTFFAMVTLLLGALVCGESSARHYGFGVYPSMGFFWDPFYWPYPYYPYYYPPTVIRVPTEPPTYVEREQPQPLAPNYWYYCFDPPGYYPSVKQCARGWIQVSPQPERKP